jgi:hypothetical protein
MKAHLRVLKQQWLVNSIENTKGWRVLQPWLWPYLLAETMGVSAAVIAITLASNFTSQQILLVTASVYSATVGYYSVLFVHTWIAEQRTHRLLNAHTPQNSLASAIRTLWLEYGSAELLDSLLFSPLLLYLSLNLLPNPQLAVVVSEVASTVAFYTAVFVIHAVRVTWVQSGGLGNWLMTFVQGEPCHAFATLDVRFSFSYAPKGGCNHEHAGLSTDCRN